MVKKETSTYPLRLPKSLKEAARRSPGKTARASTSSWRRLSPRRFPP